MAKKNVKGLNMEKVAQKAVGVISRVNKMVNGKTNWI